jgi:hypothetical protein
MSEHSNVKAAIAYDDLRDWLLLAERLGEVRNVSGASWQEDIGLAGEAVLRAETGRPRRDNCRSRRALTFRFDPQIL